MREGEEKGFFTKRGVTDKGLEALALPFNEKQIEWKIQTISADETKAMVVPYVDARAVQNRFDSVCGAENWRNHLQPVKTIRGGQEEVNMIHTISVKIDNGENGEWISKQDGSSPSAFESFKGVISTSERRAAVQWGPGRSLYGLEMEWVDIINGKGGKCKGSFKSKLDQKTKYVSFNPPKLPDEYRDDDDGDADTIQLAGFTATSWEDMLRQMKGDPHVRDAVTKTGAMVLDGVQSWEDAGKPAQVICEQLVKYFKEG